jgi:hypothetical protein
MSEITQDELLRHFDLQNFLCPVCSNKQWMITPCDQPVLSILTSTDGSFSLPPLNVPGYAAICSQCGYMRVHEAGIVRSAILKRRESP